jgi:hypothetical protein
MSIRAVSRRPIWLGFVAVGCPKDSSAERGTRVARVDEVESRVLAARPALPVVRSAGQRHGVALDGSCVLGGNREQPVR